MSLLLPTAPRSSRSRHRAPESHADGRRRPRRPLLLLASVVVPLTVVGGAGVVLAAANPAAAAPNPNCTLLVPSDPLSAKGLAPPYQLVATDRRKGACHESNTAQSAFVEATVLDPATGAVGVYHPLVTDVDRRPAAAPAPPTLPAGAVVGIWFGFNGDTLTLGSQNRGALGAGHCVNGLDRSPFGQFAYCNA